MEAVFDILDLGTVPYAQAWALQKEHHAQVVAGAPPRLLLLEHPPVLTLGRSAKEGEHIVVSRAYLAQQGIEVHAVERGGDVTYHGPGQLVAYPIFPVGRRVRDFLRRLEQCVVMALRTLGLPDARPNPGYAGVYVADREVNGLARQQKMCSIGVAIKRHVALHGLALNVTTNLQHFELIVPCGLQHTQMTSLEREYQLRGLALPGQEGALMGLAKAALVQAFQHHFQAYDWSFGPLDSSTLRPLDLDGERSEPPTAPEAQHDRANP